MNFGMKNSIILFLFLIPAFLFAQYPTTGNKSRLGWQTTGDGLIWRGVAGDTVNKPNNRNYPYFQLDTVNAVLYRYIQTRQQWQPVGGAVDIDSLIYATRFWVNSNFFPLQGGLLTGAAGAGFVGFPVQSSPPSTPATGFSLFAGSTGNNISWMQPDGFFRRLVSPVTGVARQYQFMARSYTLGDSADIANNVTSIAANYLATSNGTNLIARNLFDNNTYAGVISRPWKFGEYTTAGLPTGVMGYTVYNTTKNGPAWYQGSRWAYGLESTFNRGTAGGILFPDANGQVTQTTALTYSTNLLTLTGNRNTFTSESTQAKSHEYLFFESVGTTATQYEEVFSVITSAAGRGATIEVSVADGTNSLHTAHYIILTGNPGTTGWYVAPAFNINNVGDDIRLDVKNDGAAFRTYFRLRRVSGTTVANCAIRVRVLSWANVVTVERLTGTGTTTAPTLIWPLGNQITQSSGQLGLGTITPTAGIEIIKDPALIIEGLFFKRSPEASTGRESEKIFYESVGASGAYENVFNVITTQGGRGAVVHIDIAEGNSANYFTKSYLVHTNEVGNTNYHQLIPTFSTSGAIVMDAMHDPTAFRTYFRLRRVSGSGTINCAIKVRVISNSAGNPLLERATGSGTTTAPTTFFPFQNYLYQGGLKTGLFTTSPNYIFDAVSTDAFGLPRGTVGNQPAIAANTTPFRFFTDTAALGYGHSGVYNFLATRPYVRSVASGSWLGPRLNAGNVDINANAHELRIDSLSALIVSAESTATLGGAGIEQIKWLNTARTKYFNRRLHYDSRPAISGGMPAYYNLLTINNGSGDGFEWANEMIRDTTAGVFVYGYGGRYNEGYLKFGSIRSNTAGVYLSVPRFWFYGTSSPENATANTYHTLWSEGNSPSSMMMGLKDGGKFLIASDSTMIFDPSLDVPQFNKMGLGNKEAADLSKTQSNYNATFATDGTLLEIERKRDTTVYIDDADYDWSAAITTAQIASRFNRVIFWMTTTAGGSDSELTLHTPDANLMQVEYLIHSVDEPAGFDNKIVFGTNNAVDSTNGLVTNYYPAAGDGIHIRAGLRSGVYKYRYSN